MAAQCAGMCTRGRRRRSADSPRLEMHTMKLICSKCMDFEDQSTVAEVKVGIEASEHPGGRLLRPGTICPMESSVKSSHVFM